MTSRVKDGHRIMRPSQFPDSLAILRLVFIVAISFFIAPVANAATYYVNAGNPAPVPPYTSWLTAATNIQDAIGQTVNGDTVLVTNGVYAYGGVVLSGNLTNRIALTNAITVESVNGPWVTTILGVTNRNGNSGARCAWLTNGASLVGFTLKGGATQTSGDPFNSESGGGVWCASTNAYVNNCVIVSNTAFNYGAGVYQGTLSACLASGNQGFYHYGGTVYNAVLNNCTIVSNNIVGVVSPLAMTNCIIYYNSDPNYYNLSGSAFSFCCTTPALAGTGNFTNAPALFADGVHLANNSSCIGAGIYTGGGVDVFGETYSNPPSVGCAEATLAPLVTTPKITLTGDPVGFFVGNFNFAAASPYSISWFLNGQPLTDNGHFSGTQTASLSAMGVKITDAGNYQVIVSNAFGAVTSSVATLVIHCVNNSGINPIPPYTSWATAATNIQDAITASLPGDVVLVTNGLYNSGGKSIDGLITNRVSIDKAILVQSVNGATVTVIQGAWDPTSTNGPGAVRCVWMTNNTILSGFTICGGATREVNASGSSNDGGGVLTSSTNSMICNCLLTTNMASNVGGGISAVGNVLRPANTTVIGCTFIANQAIGGPGFAGAGGGAEKCNLRNCTLLNNSANQGNGGGVDNCNLNNCALVKNSSNFSGGGGAVNGGTLVNCTVVSNTASAVYGAKLTNCIVIDNFPGTNNYANCTFAYSCADPLPPGPGNVDVNPQFLADGFHLAQTSPCIGAGLSNVVSGTDIDGQPWNTPPSIGCDEWYPAPVIAVQPGFQVGFPPHDLTWNVVVAGQLPFNYFWTHNGTLIQDDGHYSNSGGANMVINNFGPNDAGLYQLVATNSAGLITSAVVQVVIHTVDASGANPVTPYSSWANAATTIQDAINVASPGDIVLATNGLYANGGMAVISGLTNRVALNKALTVISVNGYKATVIQGAWDPITTNGPGAIRCAWVGDGAVLNGFTLQNGATCATGDGFQFGPLESGGGVCCSSSNGVILNCVLTNNSAVYGGGAAYGTLDNSLIIGNQAYDGGGALYSSLNNCTVLNNQAGSPFFPAGAGTYSAIVRNSIVVGNFDSSFRTDDFYPSGSANYAYSCSYNFNPPLTSGVGNITQDPVFLDLFHISTLSPCYGTGSSAYSTGCDLDGDPWNNPPSMGCDEIVQSNLVGALSVNCSALFTNVLVNHYETLYGTFQGQVSFVTWSFGDGLVYSNLSSTVIHQWANIGDYPVTFTAYNNDNPTGVSTNLVVHVLPVVPVQIQSPFLITNSFRFQFAGQPGAIYLVQYSTNLNSPTTWQTLQNIYSTNQATIQIIDSSGSNGARFYRVLTE